VYYGEHTNQNTLVVDSTSDNALMLKVKEGDLDKLGLLFERYNQRLYRFFYRMTRRRDISEDLVQGVFERILKYRHSYTNNGSFATWIFQIARNLQIDHYKSNQNNEELGDFIDWDELEGESLESEKEQPEKDQLKQLQQALDQLDDTKKQTLVLSRFEGFKYKEIAEIMNCTESAVKVRIFRAINELEVLIKELKQNEL
jgi:RNA polymerase sigma-70 factor (ECF subfamily)